MALPACSVRTSHKRRGLCALIAKRRTFSESVKEEGIIRLTRLLRRAGRRLYASDYSSMAMEAAILPLFRRPRFRRRKRHSSAVK